MSDRQEADKVDLRSADVAEDKRLELLRLFPEVRTEGGKIDFDRLKLAFGEMVDVGRERHCGRRHFEALGVPFDVVVSADEV